MTFTKYILLLVIAFCQQVSAQPKEKPKNRNKTVVLIEQAPDHLYKLPLLPNMETNKAKEDSIVLKAIALTHRMHMNNPWPEHKTVILNGTAKWILYPNEPQYFFFAGIRVIANPGDSIHVHFEGNKSVLTGKGVEKTQLENALSHEITTLKSTMGLNNETSLVNSINGFQSWTNYADKALALINSVMESYKNRISDSSYAFIKFKAVEKIEEDRFYAFFNLANHLSKQNDSPLLKSELNAVFDSTLNKSSVQWMRSFSDMPINSAFNNTVIYLEILRKYNFDFVNEAINTKEKQKFLAYNWAKQKYKGRAKEIMLSYLLTNYIYKWDFKNPDRAALFNDYYSSAGFPEYKKDVKEFEDWRNSRGGMVKGRESDNFILFDQKDNKITKGDLKRKVVLINFWTTGNKDCIAMAKTLTKVEKAFEKDTNVVLLNVSGDGNKAIWLNSLRAKLYVPTRGINTRVSEKLLDYPMLKAYNVTSFPKLHLLDADGKNVEMKFKSGKANAIELIDIISTSINKFKVNEYDGPYVLNRNDGLHAYSIVASKVSDKLTIPAEPVTLTAQTDLPGKTFNITLKNNLNVEPSEYEQPEKLFSLSDIEGNFDAFRKLLQANKIIDDNFNWIFGKGHLVFAGDMFDRGTQVTECLWLVYVLEEKAKVAGGYVHFIMGNHEIMNLSNDIRYVQDKYIKNAKLLGLEYVKLYDHYSELGRWLRTKNVMEKIGNLLFLHAGVSPELNRLELNLGQINQLSRKYYAGNLDTTNKALMTLFKAETSPFWFRGYYADKINKIPTKSQLDSTLQKFGVKRIVTGHTVVSDMISTWYGNKVINTDTRHRHGESEALLIEGSNFYRVNATRKKILLFRDEEK